MDVAVFSTKPYDRRFLDAANVAAGGRHRFTYFEARLTHATAVLAKGAAAVCLFVNDQADDAVLGEFAGAGVRLVALRSAGFNNVDLAAARRLGVTVARVPAYSPDAVAEHTVAMILSLNRAIHRAYARVREGNFALEGLLGFDLKGRIVGVVGTGRIGAAVARIMLGFGCRVLAHDLAPDPACAASGVFYVALDELLAESDIVTLHCPLTPQTRHVIDADALRRMRPGAYLVNTARGALVNEQDVADACKSGRLWGYAADVLETEPVKAPHVFQDVENIIVTPHIGSRTNESVQRQGMRAANNLVNFLKGNSDYIQANTF